MLKKILIGILLYAAIVVSLFSCSVLWTSPSYYKTTQSHTEQIEKIIPFSRYNEFVDTHPRPFIVKTDQLVLFGSEHTKDPNDKQFKELQTLWHELKPTVALVEGRLGFLFLWTMDPVERYGEMGFVKHLADNNDAIVYTWEMPKEDYIAELLKTYSKVQVAIGQILSPYFSNFRFGKPESPDAFVEGYLLRSGENGLDNAVTSIKEIDMFWQVEFPEQKDWRDTSDQWGLPGVLSEMSSTGNDIRNAHLVNVISDLIRNDERVFAVMGSSHAVMLKDVFK